MIGRDDSPQSFNIFVFEHDAFPGTSLSRPHVSQMRLLHPKPVPLECTEQNGGSLFLSMRMQRKSIHL